MKNMNECSNSLSAIFSDTDFRILLEKFIYIKCDNWFGLERLLCYDRT